MFAALTVIPVLLVFGIAGVLLLRAWPVLSEPALRATLIGTTWRPQQQLFGLLPFFAGTAWVSSLGMLMAVVPCVLAALYLSEYARPRTRAIAKPTLDVLAAIPPVVYGVWGLLAVVPFVQVVAARAAERGLGGMKVFAANQPTGFGLLAGGIVLAVMVAPFIVSVLFEVLSTVPAELRHASLALGATRWQTVHRVVVPKVLPGIVAGIALGASRGLGETIAVLMVVGNVVQVPTSVFDAAYPLPALIANNYGDMMSIPLYDAVLLGAALMLLLVIVALNLLSTMVLQSLSGGRKSR